MDNALDVERGQSRLLSIQSVEDDCLTYRYFYAPRYAEYCNIDDWRIKRKEDRGQVPERLRTCEGRKARRELRVRWPWHLRRWQYTETICEDKKLAMEREAYESRNRKTDNDALARFVVYRLGES